MVEQKDWQKMTYEDFRAQHEGWAKDLLGRMDQAQNVVDLRVVWMENSLTNALSGYVRSEVYDEVARGIVKNLGRLGLDVNSEDERVSSMIEAMVNPQPDEQGAIDLGRHNPMMTGLYRILSGSDPNVEKGIKLLPIQELERSNLFGQLADVALDYTRDPQYTVAHRFPRKAGREVTDPKSRFWGFQIFTDDYPGFSFNGRSGPNVFLWMPTGLVSRETIINNTSKGDSDRRWMENNPRYMPRLIAIQEIQLGGSGSVLPVDTKEGTAKQFLASIKVEKPDKGFQI